MAAPQEPSHRGLLALPTELIIEIFCQQENLLQALNFSRHCSRLRQIFIEHIKEIYGRLGSKTFPCENAALDLRGAQQRREVTTQCITYQDVLCMLANELIVTEYYVELKPYLEHSRGGVLGAVAASAPMMSLVESRLHIVDYAIPSNEQLWRALYRLWQMMILAEEEWPAALEDVSTRGLKIMRMVARMTFASMQRVRSHVHQTTFWFPTQVAVNVTTMNDEDFKQRKYKLARLEDQLH